MVWTLLFSVLAVLQDARLPIPDSSAQKEAEKLIREVFQDEYARTSSAERQGLAQKLLTQGMETQDNPTARFVLLREARDVAALAGDAETALRAVQELAKSYEVASAPMTNAVLATAGKNAKTSEEFKVLAALYLKRAEEAAQSLDFDAACQAAGNAVSFAKRSKDVGLTAKAEAKQREYSEGKAQFEKLRKAREVLAKNPNDPAASLTVGHFLCIVKEDWEEGLAYLERGDDAPLRDLASSDRSNPTDATRQVAVGDGWWDRAAKESGRARLVLRKRAVRWYRECADRISGLAKTKVEKRLLEFRWDLSDGGWEDYTDPALFKMEGSPGQPIVVNRAGERSTAVKLHFFPKGEFDGVSVRACLGREKCQPVLTTSWLGRSFHITGDRDYVCSSRHNGAQWVVESKSPVPRKDEYVITVDGEEKLRIKAESATMTELYLQADWKSVSFDRIRLRLKK